MKRNRIYLIGVLFLLVMGMTACKPGAVMDEGALPEAMAVEESASERDAGPQVEQPDKADEPEEAEQSDTAKVEAEAEAKQPREDLEATDPSTVVLASGQPQIVEFFAFW